MTSFRSHCQVVSTELFPPFVIAPSAKIQFFSFGGKTLSSQTVLADDRNKFALTLETLALKKSANFHIFQNIKKELDARLQTENIPCSKKGKEKAIETSVVKLRAKYKWLKEQWRKVTDRAKSGSGKSAIDEPEWFTIIDPIFSETHTELKVATKAADILNSDDSSEDDVISDSPE